MRGEDRGATLVKTIRWQCASPLALSPGSPVCVRAASYASPCVGLRVYRPRRPGPSSCLGPAALWRPRERPKRGRMVPQGCQGSHAQPPSSSAPADAAYLQPAHAGSTGAQSCARMTLGLRRVLPIWAARLLCRTVRAPPPDWRGRGSRALSPHALVRTRRSVPIGCHRQVLVR